MTPDQLEALRKLAEARGRADLAALEGLLRARRECAAEAESIRAARAAEDALPLGACPPELLGARGRWADHRIAELDARMAELDQRIDAARGRAAVSLGKDEALRALRDRALGEAARLRDARRERDAPPPEERPAKSG
ncbi:hypothetical protein [Amaricoccus solimangrovi]|uniref:Flagellar FliJ protein n=1 Tax=Amaricoccus solimangrovi TaxID=2589815 RepID=A0A501WUT7_9RHOB|nr:hypothetical protein [Amaricoccus solimangrovi]TPE52502.1 hypothetical protein FJM51_04800 [Amaricoccus solimangrovi]